MTQTLEEVVEVYRGILQKDLRNKLVAKERRRNYTNHIRSGKCYECSGKLARGKKDKNNDYKRNWECTECGTDYKI